MTVQSLILGLPRSRTFWAHHFTSLNGRISQHNQFIRCRTIDEIVSYFDYPKHSASDPAVGAIWRELLPKIPHVRVALIRRPVDKVLASLRAIGEDAPFLPRLLENYDAELDALAASGLAEVFQFHLLATRDEAARLFLHCTGEPLDNFWWQVMGNRNLQSPEVGKPQTAADGPITRAMLTMVKEHGDAV